MKTLLDSNIIIYLGTDKAEQIENILVDKELNVSVITKIETLGYHNLSDKKKEIPEYAFRSY